MRGTSAAQENWSQTRLYWNLYIQFSDGPIERIVNWPPSWITPHPHFQIWNWKTLTKLSLSSDCFSAEAEFIRGQCSLRAASVCVCASGFAWRSAEMRTHAIGCTLERIKDSPAATPLSRLAHLHTKRSACTRIRARAIKVILPRLIYLATANRTARWQIELSGSKA